MRECLSRLALVAGILGEQTADEARLVRNCAQHARTLPGAGAGWAEWRAAQHGPRLGPGGPAPARRALRAPSGKRTPTPAALVLEQVQPHAPGTWLELDQVSEGRALAFGQGLEAGWRLAELQARVQGMVEQQDGAEVKTAAGSELEELFAVSEGVTAELLAPVPTTPAVRRGGSEAGGVADGAPSNPASTRGPFADTDDAEEPLVGLGVATSDDTMTAAYSDVFAYPSEFGLESKVSEYLDRLDGALLSGRAQEQEGDADRYSVEHWPCGEGHEHKEAEIACASDGLLEPLGQAVFAEQGPQAAERIVQAVLNGQLGFIRKPAADYHAEFVRGVSALRLSSQGFEAIEALSVEGEVEVIAQMGRAGGVEDSLLDPMSLEEGEAVVLLGALGVLDGAGRGAQECDEELESAKQELVRAMEPRRLRWIRRRVAAMRLARLAGWFHPPEAWCARDQLTSSDAEPAVRGEHEGEAPSEPLNVARAAGARGLCENAGGGPQAGGQRWARM
ncbi:unnamed protein product [Prorocentrum cordatum]|uniref:Uncharacterized protein n=1 Tax=Prorocentrum cordatum TaxID=2364126 RepID=A0ABN9VPY7_9DINO|nr:unnamed protein product [Polarella glacialis]